MLTELGFIKYAGVMVDQYRRLKPGILRYVNARNEKDMNSGVRQLWKALGDKELAGGTNMAMSTELSRAGRDWAAPIFGKKQYGPNKNVQGLMTTLDRHL